MIVHLVVYSALIKNNELSFPDRFALDFYVGFPLFQNYEWVLPQICRKIFKRFDINPSRKVITNIKIGTLFLVMLRYMEPAAISLSGRENLMVKFCD